MDERKRWTTGKTLAVVFCMLVGLVFFWLGAPIWFIVLAGILGIVAQVV